MKVDSPVSLSIYAARLRMECLWGWFPICFHFHINRFFLPLVITLNAHPCGTVAQVLDGGKLWFNVHDYMEVQESIFLPSQILIGQ